MRAHHGARRQHAGRMYSRDDVLAVAKPRDAWWTVLLTDPIAIPLVKEVANRTRIGPAQLTALAVATGIGAALCFVQGSIGWLIAGAALFQAGFVLDCMDGKLARLTGTGSVFGGWLDFAADQTRFLMCAMALLIGRYHATGQTIYLYASVFVVFCDLFRYVNATQMAKVKRSMRARMRKLPAGGPPRPAGDGPDGAYARLRRRLLDRRIRMHLVSGIEFQMAVCVVAPVSTAIVPVVLVAGGLLLVFEAALVARLWRSTRRFARVLAEPEAPPTATTSTGPARATTR